MSKTLYWYDFEAGGANPRVDHPSQFAGVRTDENLTIIGEPLVEYCQLSADYLPHPQACLITGITPQKQQRLGLAESDFARRIHHEFSQPDTTIVGYNNIRFDDEMSRFLFYRNFYDPYAYSWQHGNSRWDLVDLARACYALRPQGIEWPVDPDTGVVTFRLEKLSTANGIEHGQAHDAMSDVYATIGLARAIRTAQPRLYDFYYNLRRKAAVQKLIDDALVQGKALVHVSSHYGTQQGNVCWVLPLAPHPTQSNAVIAWRLDRDPTVWADIPAEQIVQTLYAPRDTLNDPSDRPGLMTIVTNKCPFIAPLNTLSAERAEEFGLNWAIAQQHLQSLHHQRELKEHLIQALAAAPEREQDGQTDVEQQLYSGPFFSDQARSQMEIIRSSSAEQLSVLNLNWDDPRLAELLFRYRARNYPATLNQGEIERWRQHCRERLMYGSKHHLSVDELVLELERLSTEHAQNSRNMTILKALAEYIQTL